jgi:predicted esterase
MSRTSTPSNVLANDPHSGQSILGAGPQPERAAATLILVHGRGATAGSILPLHGDLGLDDLAALAPQAVGNTWYPYPFMSPLAVNQPYLDSALRRLESIVTGLIDRGVASERIALLGFSQGACLTTEFVARHPRRYGAVMGLTGGLIGPPGTPRDYAGSLRGTPVFLGSGDPDPHIPFERVLETEAVLTRMGANVEVRRYPGMPHGINADEIEACRALLRALVESPR